MCDTSAFILRQGKEERILESVERVEFEGDAVRITTIFGEETHLKARLKLIDHRENKLVFEAL